MMGHREKTISGDEWDLLFWRGAYCYQCRPGVTKRIKNGMMRRLRRSGKEECRHYMEAV